MQRLSTSSSLVTFSLLPAASLRSLKCTSKALKAISESDWLLEVRRSCVVVVKPTTGKDLAKAAGRLVDGFLKPDSFPMDSVRLEWEKLEKGDKKSTSFDSPYYRFLQLRVGGIQGYPEPFEQDLYINGLDPKEDGPARKTRKAWWASVRSVLDGLPIPPNARILLLGDRRLGGRSAYSFVMAMVWTGSDYGVLKLHMDPTYLAGDMICAGGIKENIATSALSVLLERSAKVNSFHELAEEFETAADKMAEHQAWDDQWTYPPMEDDRFYQDVETLESHFSVTEKPDLGPWCFGQ
mmetsp:Transcript_3119/g.7253  ORF Transcript_3119/g.7253 Transcript_3119/m.7253 type:complete len:295 (-) Transcript_3119:128-1012(-)